MVNSSPYKAHGPMRGRNASRTSCGPWPVHRGGGTGIRPAGNAQEDEHGSGDLPGGDLDAGLGQAQPAGQHRQVEPAQHGEHDDLEHEFNATRTAAASRSPQARSFQMMTMAMQRASPTMISPVRYSGRSASSRQASVNITAGPISQFSSSEDTISLRSAVTSSSWS